MRFLTYLIFLTFVFQAHLMQASAQSLIVDGTETVEIGNGLFVDILPAKFKTMVSDDPGPSSEPDWVIIPATYETIIETIIIQEAYKDVEIFPPTYALNGSMTTPAIAILQEVPAITKQIERRVVKTPSRVVKRVIPHLYHPPIIRRKIEDEIYIVKDSKGKELQRFKEASAFADYMNSQ